MGKALDFIGACLAMILVSGLLITTILKAQQALLNGNTADFSGYALLGGICFTLTVLTIIHANRN